MYITLISKIAAHIAPVLDFLYKWVFYQDAQVDNIKEYMQIKHCHKLIIWDSEDEVIPDVGSLKRRVMIEYFHKNFLDFAIGN